MATEINNKSTGRKMPKLPSEQDLVAFDHSAAGHEGISSNASGSLVIKPCTQAEVDFYISAADHELFQAHMPTFIGVLNLEPDQGKLKSFLEHAKGVAPVQQMLDTASRPMTPVQQTSTSSWFASSPIDPQINKRASWKPSGGKKLDTGLAIVLENAAAGFKHPNILDVKLGARLWDDDAPQAKRRKLDDVANETTSGSLGFRIAGMKLWRGSDHATVPPQGDQLQTGQEPNMEIKNDYKCYDKNYGRAFTKDNVSDAFIAYLGGADVTNDSKKRLKNKRAKDIAERFLRELESVQFVLENQESRMYSASILMVYEGDPEALEVALREEALESQAEGKTDVQLREHDVQETGEKTSLRIDTHVTEQDTAEQEEHDEGDADDDDDDEVEPKVHDVRLIDFAHARWTPGLGPDENMIQGVRSVISILKDLIAAQ